MSRSPLQKYKDRAKFYPVDSYKKRQARKHARRRLGGPRNKVNIIVKWSEIENAIYGGNK